MKASTSIAVTLIVLQFFVPALAAANELTVEDQSGWNGTSASERPRPRVEASMKVALTVAAAESTVLASVGAEPRELDIVAAVTVGERSKDRSSRTETITVQGNSLLWDQSFAGASRGRNAAAPERKSFTLTAVDRENLLKLAREGGLIATETIELPQRPPLAYFVLKLETSAGREKGAVTISGSRSAVELDEVPLYRNSLALVQELYRIMQRQDKSMVFEELVRPLP